MLALWAEDLHLQAFRMELVEAGGLESKGENFMVWAEAEVKSGVKAEVKSGFKVEVKAVVKAGV